MSTIEGAWCVVLASRKKATAPEIALPEYSGTWKPASLITRDPLAETVRRAHAVASRENILAVIAADAGHGRPGAIGTLDPHNVLVQPSHQGTAYEVLLALLHLALRVPPETPVVFLPSDHVVSDEDVVTDSLLNMIEWIGTDPHPVYLLGAVPEGPHDQLGYIIPWYDAFQMATGVYEFVEEPEVRLARKLIDAGGLWNTFIFGGTLASLTDLFRQRFGATIDAMQHGLRIMLNDAEDTSALRGIYDHVAPADFSQDVLTDQTDRLSVLRMPRCGWWPLKAPKRRFGSLSSINGTAEQPTSKMIDGNPPHDAARRSG